VYHNSFVLHCRIIVNFFQMLTYLGRIAMGSSAAAVGLVLVDVISEHGLGCAMRPNSRGTKPGVVGLLKHWLE